MPYNSDFEKIMRKYESKKKITRAKAIRIYCKEMCCAGDLVSWRNCSFTACPLFNFRTGRETLERGKPFQKQRKSKGVLGKNDALNQDIKVDSNNEN